MCKKILGYFVFLLSLTSNSEVRIILTAALTDQFYEFRKNQYITSMKKLHDMGYHDFYIVESLAKKPYTFLDDFCSHVFYASCNNSAIKNQGINEISTLYEACKQFQFSDEDIIVKITGRYLLISDVFLKFVRNTTNVYDAFFKIGSSDYLPAVCFGIRFKFLKKFIESLDFERMEREWIDLEKALAWFVHSKVAAYDMKIVFVDSLDLECNTYGSSSWPGSNKIIRF